MAKLNETAKLLDVTPRRVQQLASDGIIPKPEQGEYDLAKCVISYIRYIRRLAQGSGDLSLTDERTRLAKEQADRAERENLLARGDLVPVGIVAGIFEKVFSALRAKIVSIPGKIAPQIVGLNNVAEVKGLLESVHNEALAELSTADLSSIVQDAYRSPEKSTGEPSASVEIDGERMGGSIPETVAGVVG